MKLWAPTPKNITRSTLNFSFFLSALSGYLCNQPYWYWLRSLNEIVFFKNKKLSVLWFERLYKDFKKTFLMENIYKMKKKINKMKAKSAILRSDKTECKGCLLGTLLWRHISELIQSCAPIKAATDVTTHYLRSLCFSVLWLLFLSSWASHVNENCFHFFHNWHLGLKRHLFGGQCRS